VISENEESEILPPPTDDLVNSPVEDVQIEVEELQDLPPPSKELLVQQDDDDDDDQLSAQTEHILDNEVEIQPVSLLTEINQELSAPLIEQTPSESLNHLDPSSAAKSSEVEPESAADPFKDKKKLRKSFVKRVKSFKLSNKKRTKREELENESRVVADEAPKQEPELALESDNILIMTVVVLTDENREPKRGAEEKAEAVLAAVTEAAKVATLRRGSEGGSYASHKPPLSPTTWSEVRRQNKHRY